MGSMEDAETGCNKAISVDRNRADAYFVKGLVMFSKGKLDAKNKYVVPAGTSDALKKIPGACP